MNIPLNHYKIPLNQPSFGWDRAIPQDRPIFRIGAIGPWSPRHRGLHPLPQRSNHRQLLPLSWELFLRKKQHLCGSNYIYNVYVCRYINIYIIIYMWINTYSYIYIYMNGNMPRFVSCGSTGRLFCVCYSGCLSAYCLLKSVWISESLWNHGEPDV